LRSVIIFILAIVLAIFGISNKIYYDIKENKSLKMDLSSISSVYKEGIGYRGDTYDYLTAGYGVYKYNFPVIEIQGKKELVGRRIFVSGYVFGIFMKLFGSWTALAFIIFFTFFNTILIAILINQLNLNIFLSIALLTLAFFNIYKETTSLLLEPISIFFLLLFLIFHLRNKSLTALIFLILLALSRPEFTLLPIIYLFYLFHKKKLSIIYIFISILPIAVQFITNSLCKDIFVWHYAVYYKVSYKNMDYESAKKEVYSCASKRLGYELRFPSIEAYRCKAFNESDKCAREMLLNEFKLNTQFILKSIKNTISGAFALFIKPTSFRKNVNDIILKIQPWTFVIWGLFFTFCFIYSLLNFRKIDSELKILIVFYLLSAIIFFLFWIFGPSECARAKAKMIPLELVVIALTIKKPLKF